MRSKKQPFDFVLCLRLLVATGVFIGVGFAANLNFLTWSNVWQQIYWAGVLLLFIGGLGIGFRRLFGQIFAVSGVIVLAIGFFPNATKSPLLTLVSLLALLGTLVFTLDQSTHMNLRSSAFAPIRWHELLFEHPARLLVTTFALLCFVGTFLLKLPGMSSTPLTLINTAFTAVSAVCVTGLVVVDTSQDFTLAGQIVIVLLIQAGGLGIMSFSTAIIHLLGQRLSLRHEQALVGIFGIEDRSRLSNAIRRLFGFTFLVEAVGMVCLFIAFCWYGDSWETGLWRAIFTSISAFCNAGFALQSDSLMPYQSNPWILHIIAILIIAGGLSPAIALALPHVFRSGPRASVTIRIAWVASLLLWIGGFLLFLSFEWGHTLADLSVVDKIHNAWFQSVTTRTAGFNSIDIAAVEPTTQAFVSLWMFIGGCPGGTAGGIKVTTAAVLLLGIATTLRGRSKIIIFHRQIRHQTVYKGAAIATISVVSIFVLYLAIMLTQNMEPEVALFEVISALGTVGLSLGGTMALDEVGKSIIILAMFMGRVGSLTLLAFLGFPPQQSSWEYPEEEVPVG